MEQERKLKLELTWVNKDKPLKLETRLLIEDESKSYHACAKHGVNDQFENMLIHGDNLLALKALLPKYRGLVKCIYIDPPYNTGAAFEHYNDNMEHSKWLSLMRSRLDLLKELLTDDGSIWISIDDDEGHYLKVLCDEIFGRNNFVNTCIWQKKGTRSNDARWFSDNHDFILVYAKNKLNWKMSLLPRPEDSTNGYSNPDNDPRGIWASGPCHAKTPNAKDIYEITTPSGKKIMPPSGTSWRFSKERFAELIEDNRIWFGEKGNNVPRYKRFFTEVKEGFVPTTLWFRDEVGDNQEAKKEAKTFNSESVFATPKPERLIHRILTLATKPGDLILDSFLGSGTTAAVAHKMGRRWIGIEMGDHAYTHCKTRLDKVIAGEDNGGITKEINWKGGGGYRFYELAPSLLKNVPYKVGDTEIIIPVIDEEKFDAVRLAQAVCVNVGYTYSPSKSEYFIHGKSTENAFIYVTTDYMTEEHLNSISNALGDRSLLICCTGADTIPSNCKNISVKTIPAALLESCEWGKDNYSLNVQNLPEIIDDDLDLFDDVEA